MSLLGSEVSRRRVLQLAGVGVALPLLSSLAACSPSGAPSTSARGRGGGKLTYVFNGDATQAAVQKAQYELFIKANPNIDFVAQGVPAANWAAFSQAIATRIAGGSAPDVIDIATEGLALFRSKKLVKSLDSFIAKDKSTIDEFYSDIDPAFKSIADKYGNPGSTTYFMVGGFNTVCTWANTEVFKAAGVDLPGEEDWTWDDYEAAAKKIKAKTGAYIGFGGAHQFNAIMPWLLTNGASTMNEDWTKPTADSDAAIEAAEFFAMMVAKGYFTKPGGNVDEPALVSQGKVASLWAGRWQLSEFKKLNMVDKLEIVKMPKKTTNGSPIGWDTFPILASSQNTDAAWEFVKFTTSKKYASVTAAAGGNNIPARRSVAESDAFLDGAPKGTNLLYEAVKYATAVPSPARGDLTQNAVESAWASIASGQISAERGMKQLNEKLASLL